ncbi:MAG: hypothetical protein EA351_02210 [Gemmatimonadales bacterium]|nr:MAG: hypothetical protein EA351_02210 [Gemmatimonadales bacterium]
MMTESTAEQLLEARRARIQKHTGRPLRAPAVPEADTPLTEKQHEYLLEEAQELYWNDLEWENITEEERMEGGPVPELTFPGVLAFVRGLLLTEVPSDSPVGPSPRPQVVEAFLRFLSARIVELQAAAHGDVGEEGDRAALELRMTEGLLDRVLMTFHGIQTEDVGPLGDE